jgi:poly(A) polymerase Pap1
MKLSKIFPIDYLLFDRRKWPNPVTLKPIEEYPMNFRVWNPKVGFANREMIKRWFEYSECLDQS